MISRTSNKLWMLGAVALCMATGSEALTLGRARGSALLGQPLDVSVAVQAAADESVSADCFEAEVYYGDVRQESGLVRVSVGDAAPGQTIPVRVSVQAFVDEPVVTLYLRGGCGMKTMRKYVLLADLASETTAPALQLPVARPAPQIAAPAPQPAAAATPIAKPTVAPPPAVEAPKKQRAAAKPAGNPPATALRSSDRLGSARAQESVVKRPRLKLAAIDLPERDPVLRLSNELLSNPVEDVQKRTEAAALWRALNMGMQDVLSEQERSRLLDADFKALREQTAKNQAQLLELGSRLEKAESQRYANPLVYGLVLLLMVMVGGLIWAWRRMREANVDPWWSGSVDSMHDEQPVREAAPRPVSRPAARAEAPRPVVANDKTIAYATTETMAGADQGVDIEIDLEMGPSVFAPVARDEAGHLPPLPNMVVTDGPKGEAGVRDFAHSVAGTLRAINSQELLDVRQQADFFMTLGQYDDAIAMLENDIKGSRDSNPLVYLDLLKILHTLSRKEEFDRYRREFNVLFTGEVPEYVHFNQSGNRLEQYPDVCQQICDAWHSPNVLETIERYLVKSPASVEPWHFDLEAYRDLLLLHGVASRVGAESDSAAAPFKTTRPGPAQALDHVDLPIIEPPQDLAPNRTQDVDLNLDSASHNLIDFEVSGFSSSAGLTPSKK